MTQFDKKTKAHALRRKGKSLGEISQSLGISKSSASLWCRDITLTSLQHKKLRKQQIVAGYKGRQLGTERNRQKKIDIITNEVEYAKKEISALSNRDLLMIAVALYWAEGTKVGPSFIFVNSDPVMVSLFCRFLYLKISVAKTRIRPTIQINVVHKKRIEEVVSFWARTLDIPRSQFAKPCYVKTRFSKKYKNFSAHYGTLRLRVLKSSGLQYRMLGYINALKQN